MAREAPRELVALLDANDEVDRERAWSAFLNRYNEYILGTTRYLTDDYDAGMDRYRYVLEELRRDRFKRLRAYSPVQGSRFSTWLVVVVRRLCYDYARSHYGRSRPEEGARARDATRIRRRLLDLVGEDLDTRQLPDRSASNPELALRSAELTTALEEVLSELDPDDRLLLKLRFEDELPVSRIARVMNFPSVFHVYRRLRSALASLRQSLEARGFRGPLP